MTPQRIAAVIPALNEAAHLGALVSEVRRYLPDVIVVDDGSIDGTGGLLRTLGVPAIRHPRNLGKGMALRSGFRSVLDEGYDGCVVLDGDAQHSPADIPSFLEAAADPEVGVVIGNRMDDTGSMPLIRRWTNRFMSAILSNILREEIPDTQCGFRYIRSDLLRLLDLQTNRYAIDSEILIEAKGHGFRIRSVPIRTIYRNQKSGIRPLRDTYFFLKLLYDKRLVFKRAERR